MKKTLAFVMILLSAIVSSCWYNRKWEDLHPSATGPGPGGCSDTAGIVMSYSTHIAPLIQTNCSTTSVACHKSGGMGGDLTTHAGVSVFCSGSPSALLAAIQHTGPSPMPQGAPKLPDCEIAKVAKWLQNGFPNN